MSILFMFACLVILLGMAALVTPILYDVFFLPSVKTDPVELRESRLARFGDSLSQAGNVLLFNGNQNHSISGDAWRYGRARTSRIANWLFRDTAHCRHAHLKDVWLADRLTSQTPAHLIAEARQLFGRENG